MIEIDVDIRKTITDRRGRRFDLRARFDSRDEFVVLFGASGSGKSLTLQSIAGLVRPDAGRIRIGNHVLFDSAAGIDLPIQQRQVGYLFQDYALFPHLSVAQNVAIGVKPLGRGMSEELRAHVEAMLEVFELKPHADALPRDLSGGQRQRVALARALIKRPEVLLLDEPFAALNPLLRARMRSELARIREHFSVPVLLITHDEEDLKAFGETVVMYEAGNVAEVFPFKQLIREQGERGRAAFGELLARIGVEAARAAEFAPA